MTVRARDTNCNITAIKTYDFTTGTLGTLRNTQSFTYRSSGWRDLLLHVGYDYISYDAIGNPTMIYDNYVSGDDYPENGAVLSWQGRELTKYEVIESYGVLESYSYTYNADGIRTSKTISGIKHEYLLNGNQIVRETWTESGIEHMLVYLYDEKGAPVGLRYRTSTYEEDVYLHFFFEKNLQGDIVALYDENGNKIGTYTYDAWGNCTVTSLTSFTINNTILNTYNPFRYRGYYYDVETGWYYLQSRYYNPQWGRFISPDRHDVINATPMALTDKNLFAYCDNNPISRIDEDGEFWNIAAGALIGAAINVASGYLTAKLAGEEYTWKNVLVDGVSGAITGAIASTPLGAMRQGVVNGIVSAAGSVALDLLNGEDVNVERAVNAGALGFATGYWGGDGLRADPAVKSADKTCIKVLNKINSNGYATVRGAKSAMTQAINGLHKALVPAVKETAIKYARSSAVNAIGMYTYDYSLARYR